MPELIEIDGSLNEEGDLIVRTAITLSAITQKPCHIYNIRQKREKPGLMPQHLQVFNNIAKLCDGYLEGNEIGSLEIKFWPQKIKTENIHLKIDTADSITLILQTLLPIEVSFAKESFTIYFDGGGTAASFSPTIDYFKYVFLQNLKKLGLEIELEILKHGYYPAGGAKVEATILPSRIQPSFYKERGGLKRIFVLSNASESLRHNKIAERQIFGAREILSKTKLPLIEEVNYYQTESPGSHLCIFAEFENAVIGTDSIGKLDKKAEDLGKETGLNLLKEGSTKAIFDTYAADQILIFRSYSFPDIKPL